MAGRRTKGSTTTSRTSFDAKGKIICLFGESPLVEEYAVRSVAQGFEVHARLNQSDDPTSRKALPSLPKGVKSVKKASRDSYVAIELTNTSPSTKRKNLAELDASLPSRTVIISSSVVATVAEQSTWVRHPERIIGVGALPSFLEGDLIEFAPSPQDDPSTRSRAREFASAVGKDAAFVRDSVGMVLPRIVCMLANEAFFAMMEDVATGVDIDTAMKFGTNYPSGPVEWAGKIGPRHVYAVMEALAISFGEDRYRPAPLLRRAAFLDSVPRK